MTSSKFTTVYSSEAPVIFADHAMVQYNCLGEPDGNKQVTASQINSGWESRKHTHLPQAV